MYGLALFPIIAAGFILAQDPNYYYKKIRRRAQYSYVITVALGTYCALLVLCISMITLLIILSPISSHIVFMTIQEVCLNSAISTYIYFSLSTLLVAIIWKNFSTFISDKIAKHLAIVLEINAEDDSLYRSSILFGLFSDSPFDKMLGEALIFGHLLMITLESRKVYVGRIEKYEPEAETGTIQEIAIVPIMSGYRSRYDLQLYFTTHYDVLEDGPNSDHDLTVVIPRSNISLASRFNLDIYESVSSNIPEQNKRSVGGLLLSVKSKLSRFRDCILVR